MCTGCKGTRINSTQNTISSTKVRKTYATSSPSNNNGFGKPAVKVSFGKRK